MHAGFTQVEGDHDPQVVVEPQGTAEHDGATEPPQLGIDGDADEVELADEAQRHGDTGQREHHHRHHRRQIGALPEQTAITVQGVRILAAIGAGHHADDAEGPQAGEQVHQQVDTRRFHRHLAEAACHHHRQQIAEVGDGGVTHHPLDVGLDQRQEVADHDGDDCHGRQQPVDHGIRGGGYRQVEAQQHAEHRYLAHGGEEGGHRCRRPFIDVRGPEVEGGEGQLERKADQHQAKAPHQQRMVSRALGQGHTEIAEAQASGLGVEQRHAEQQEGGGTG